MLMKSNPVPATALVWILCASEADEAARRLKCMHEKRKDGPDRDALWSGMWSLEQERNESINQARERGLLLHFGAVRIERVEGGYSVRSAHA